MKNYLLTSLLMFLIAVVSTGCSKGEKVDDSAADSKKSVMSIEEATKDVNPFVEKFVNNKMTEADYAEAIEILANIDNANLDAVEKALETSNSMSEFQNKVQILQLKSGEAVQKLQIILMNLTPQDMGDKNYDKLEKVMNNSDNRFSDIQDKLIKKFPAVTAPAQTEPSEPAELPAKEAEVETPADDTK